MHPEAYRGARLEQIRHNIIETISKHFIGSTIFFRQLLDFSFGPLGRLSL
jgi:hypothetical protein